MMKKTCRAARMISFLPFPYQSASSQVTEPIVYFQWGCVTKTTAVAASIGKETIDQSRKKAPPKRGYWG